ncbi:polysaccharide deacetylase family protein [Ruminiclostridium cellulolyticum]|uniref:Polysaccharide deacetylase n=1 Tax=Ruminiclostridium cellulolyticum (strain ATCC 35319 / DSM 5812 / JCM 6584 / H10) TaxID=394503 RepID=B8I728_RUMCH|nr:polysaccharide deacetylase family protein [Ruminiclostridium cellulolyticum]ACL74952.1 polysaccharide deacetylase [Ruminiclostridium cellulolyticum H10]
MKKNKAITVLAVIVGIALIFVFFIIKKNRNPKLDSVLSDFGGVYSVSSKNVDFSTELTGRLIEGNRLAIDRDLSDKSSYPNDKKRCWGMARQPNNQIPRADPGTPELLSKYGAKYLGDVSKKIIYLTFDEGYENGYTGQILDTLRDNNVKAAFFITGPYLKEHQDLVRRMVEEGHTVGNHTIHHPSLPEKNDTQIEEEVVGLDRAFSEKFGVRMNFLRPPKGEYSERTLSITSKLGYCNLFWSFAYDDWYRDRVRGPEYTYKVVMRNLHNGEVMLLHAVSKDNADALGMIIKGARENGYEFGNVRDLAN